MPTSHQLYTLADTIAFGPLEALWVQRQPRAVRFAWKILCTAACIATVIPFLLLLAAGVLMEAWEIFS